MPPTIVNGKRVNVPSSATPEEIISATGKRPAPGRTVIKTNKAGKGNDYFDPGRVIESTRATTLKKFPTA
ncbi:MAG: hypothetical protein IJT47_06490 [Selenomonadaceae bacterium]|nr:hypothetical protein [Selenomonadaceae bacterium]